MDEIVYLIYNLLIGAAFLTVFTIGLYTVVIGIFRWVENKLNK